MTRIMTIAAAFVAMLLVWPMVVMADEYNYDNYERDPFAVLDLDRNKCVFIPDRRYPQKKLFTDKYKFFRHGFDLKLICFFPYVYDSYFQDEDGFKCVVAKNWRFFKRTYDSEFDVKYGFAILKCEFEKKVHRPGYDW